LSESGGSDEGPLTSRDERLKLIRQRGWLFYLRYLIVGGVNTAFGYCVFAALTFLLSPHLDYAYVFAGLSSHVVNVTFSYSTYRFFIFGAVGGFLSGWWKAQVSYFLSGIPGAFLLVPLVHGLIFVGISEVAAPYIAGAIGLLIQVVISLYVNIRFVFRGKE
jgi:hypothetical protein